MDKCDQISADHFLKFHGKLTRREKELIEACASGYTEIETARESGTSHHTVKHQMSDIYKKLGIMGLNVTGRNKRVMLAWWWWNIGSKKP